jgi:Na+/melibiose symporter-like transporter
VTAELLPSAAELGCRRRSRPRPRTALAALRLLAAGLVVITVITIVLLQLLPPDGPGSAYAQWGWRIPFAIGFVLSAAIFLYYLRSVPESELWTRMPKADRPLRTLLRGRNARSLGLAFLVGTGAWLTLDATVGVFAGHLKGLGTSPAAVNAAILTAAVIGIGMFPLIGAAGQRHGRRRVFLVIGALNGVVAPVPLGVAIAGRESTAAVLVAGGLVVGSYLSKDLRHVDLADA